jgi:hypothetical protein
VKEAKIQMKNLKIEAEKGFRRTLFEPELVDPNMEINFVKDTEDLSRSPHPVSKSYRKGNSLNHTVHVDKESGVTHGADLTMFPYNWRVIYSPLMELAEIQSIEAARLKLWIETMDKVVENI